MIYKKLLLDDASREKYPNADVQHCLVHKARTKFSKICVQHKTDFPTDLKTVHTALNHDLSLASFDTTKARWDKLYSKEIKSWEDQLPTLLTFFKYSAKIKGAIYTVNPIERMNKKFKSVYDR
uniref:transposase n=1 Tax=Paenibacillus kobensis TaxID=59841 RepID=UPI0013E32F97